MIDYTNYRFYIYPISMLNEPAPDDCPWRDWIVEAAVYDEDGTELTPAVTKRKTRQEWWLHYEVNNAGTEVCASLRAKENDHCRYPAATHEDVLQHCVHDGFAYDDTLNKDQYDALMATAEWRKDGG
jgi:hypothetical protein